MQTQIDLAERVLGQTAGVLTLPEQAGLRFASAHMAQQAVRELAILSGDLDAPLYDVGDFLDAVQRLAIQGRHRLPVRILLLDAEPAVRSGHRLIELARKHPSHIQIRRIPTEIQQNTDAYLLADGRGYVLRRSADAFEGTADYNAPVPVRRMQDRFDRIWEASEIPQDLRRLQI